MHVPGYYHYRCSIGYAYYIDNFFSSVPVVRCADFILYYATQNERNIPALFVNVLNIRAIACHLNNLHGMRILVQLEARHGLKTSPLQSSSRICEKPRLPF